MEQVKKKRDNNAWAKSLGFRNYYEYQTDWVQRKGFKDVRDYRLKTGKEEITDEWRVKKIEDGCPNNAKEIPFAPGYFVTPDATIYHKSKLRKKWIIIKQQTQKSGYNVFQPYIDGKRHVKYVHRGVLSAFEGIRDGGYECHHIDQDNSNNHIDNLMWMDKYEHRCLARGKYNK